MNRSLSIGDGTPRIRTSPTRMTLVTESFLTRKKRLRPSLHDSVPVSSRRRNTCTFHPLFRDFSPDPIGFKTLDRGLRVRRCTFSLFLTNVPHAGTHVTAYRVWTGSREVTPNLVTGVETCLGGRPTPLSCPDRVHTPRGPVSRTLHNGPID